MHLITGLKDMKQKLTELKGVDKPITVVGGFSTSLVIYRTQKKKLVKT